MNYRSPLAMQARTLARGYRTGKFLERHLAPCAVVVHTTGAGPVRRATERIHAGFRAKYDVREGDAFHAAVALYARVMNACGHYVVGQQGEIVQLVPESHAAWHVGGAGSRPYFTRPGDWHRGSKMAWWVARWPGYESPRGLGGGHLWDPPHEELPPHRRVLAGMPIGSCNMNTIGIEVVPPLANPTAPWSAEAWDALTRLILDVCARNAIPLKRDRVISHSDAHPLERTTASGRAWDPSSSQWSWDRFERSIAGLPAHATA